LFCGEDSWRRIVKPRRVRQLAEKIGAAAEGNGEHTGGCRRPGKISEKNAKAAVIVRPVREYRQHFRTKFEHRYAPQSGRNMALIE
jgi:hypothetical protein